VHSLCTPINCWSHKAAMPADNVPPWPLAIQWLPLGPPALLRINALGGQAPAVLFANGVLASSAPGTPPHRVRSHRHLESSYGSSSGSRGLRQGATR
jgi:hypothetical protein